MKAQAMLLLSFSLAACQPDPVYDFVWEGKHVTVHGFERSEADTCAGSFEALDAHSASIVEFFDYNESLHYEYKWMSQDYWEGRCRPGAGACTASGVPLTRTVPDMHEAAHAVVYASMGHTCPSLLSEGIATYLTRPRFYKDWATNPEISGELGEALTEGPLAGEHYNLAGHFVSFLVEDHGPEALMRLCELVPYYNTVADWEAASEEVLGVELEQLIEQYEQYPICSQQQYRARLWECAGQPDMRYCQLLWIGDRRAA